MGLFSPRELAPLLERAANAGVVVTEHYYDAADDVMIERRSQDHDPILDWNKERQLDAAEVYRGSDFKLAASIPIVLLEHWAHELGISWRQLMSAEGAKILNAKLNDPENKFLRVWPGRL